MGRGGAQHLGLRTSRSHCDSWGCRRDVRKGRTEDWGSAALLRTAVLELGLPGLCLQDVSKLGTSMAPSPSDQLRCGVRAKAKAKGTAERGSFSTKGSGQCAAWSPSRVTRTRERSDGFSPFSTFSRALVVIAILICC